MGNKEDSKIERAEDLTHSLRRPREKGSSELQEQAYVKAGLSNDTDTISLRFCRIGSDCHVYPSGQCVLVKSTRPRPEQVFSV